MKHKTEWVIGTILVIIGLLLTAGFFNSPSIIKIRQGYTDYTCPSSLYSSFQLSFANHGSKDASLCVYAWSDNNITFSKSSDCLYVPLNSQTDFRLTANESSFSSNIRNVTVYYEFIYKKNFLQLENHTTSCFYNREASFGSFSLASEKAIN